MQGIHPVERKLEQSILPYFVSAEKLRWQPFYLAYSFYIYTHDLLAALVGVGVSHPLLRVFVGGESSVGGTAAFGDLSTWTSWFAQIFEGFPKLC